MQRIQLSAELVAKLGHLDDAAELCDETGAAKAVVMPVELYREMLSAWADTAFNEADIARARNEPGGYTTTEVIAFINKLVADRNGK